MGIKWSAQRGEKRGAERERRRMEMREGHAAVKKKKKKVETGGRIDEGICRCECNRKVFAELGDEERIFQGHRRDKDSWCDGKAHRAI